MSAVNVLAAVRKRRTVTVDLPSIEAKIFVRALTTPELTQLSAELSANEDDSYELMKSQILHFVSDENGNRLFTAEEAKQFVDDAEFSVTKKIVQAGSDLNSPSDAAVEIARGN